MQLTLNIDENLFGKASQVTGIREYSALIHEGLKALILSQTGRRPSWPRPIGLAKNRFQVPPEFFDELPEEMLNAFEGKDSSFVNTRRKGDTAHENR